MFAIKGIVSELTKCKSVKGDCFYRIMLKKELKKAKLSETYMEFFSFVEDVNKKFLSEEIIVNDIIEFTFYIKGVRKDERTFKNNLMVRNVSLIKKGSKRA